jgi:hypothetical protein
MPRIFDIGLKDETIPILVMRPCQYVNRNAADTDENSLNLNFVLEQRHCGPRALANVKVNNF